MYFQTDETGRIVGTSIETDPLFPFDAELQENFNDYRYIDGEFVLDAFVQEPTRDEIVDEFMADQDATNDAQQDTNGVLMDAIMELAAMVAALQEGA